MRLGEQRVSAYVGRLLDEPYQFESVIGEGGMGKGFLGRQYLNRLKGCYEIFSYKILQR